MKFAALVAEADKGQLAEMVKLSKTSLLVVPDGGSDVERTKVLVRAEVNCTLTLSKPQDSLSTASRFCPLKEIVVSAFNATNWISMFR